MVVAVVVDVVDELMAMMVLVLCFVPRVGRS